MLNCYTLFTYLPWLLQLTISLQLGNLPTPMVLQTNTKAFTHASTHAGRQNTLLHCFRNYTGYASRSASSSGCVFWHITVCMAQHQRICQTACGRHQMSSLVVFVLLTLLVPSTRRATLGDRAFPVAAARAWNCLPAQTRTASSLTTFRLQTKTYLFRHSFGWRKSIITVPTACRELNLNTYF